MSEGNEYMQVYTFTDLCHHSQIMILCSPENSIVTHSFIPRGNLEKTTLLEKIREPLRTQWQHAKHKREDINISSIRKLSYL